VNADAIFTTGAEHVICEDYARAGVIHTANGNAEFPFAVLSDGCSSSAHTDVGARLLTSTLLEAWRGHPSAGWQGVITHARLLAQFAGYSQECLDATLLYARGDGEEHIDVGVIGDGFVAARRVDGVIDYWEIDYDGVPAYLSYALNRERTQAFMDHTKGARSISHYRDGSLVSERFDRVNPADDSVHWSMKLPVARYDLVVLLSDGASSFRAEADDGSSRAVPTWEIVKRVCAVKTTAGQFMTRRCRRFLRRFCVDNRWTHADDFAVAGMAAGGPR